MKKTSIALLLGALVLTSACSHTEPTLSDQLASDFEQSESSGSLPPADVVSSEPISSEYSDDAFAPAPLAPEPVKSYKKAKKAKHKAKKRLAKAKGKKKSKRKGLARRN